jgi:hypothetical protein
MTLIMALLLIDCIIVSSWAIFDPMHRDLQNLTLEIDPSDRSVVYQPQVRKYIRYFLAYFWNGKDVKKGNNAYKINAFTIIIRLRSAHPKMDTSGSVFCTDIKAFSSSSVFTWLGKPGKPSLANIFTAFVLYSNDAT